MLLSRPYGFLLIAMFLMALLFTPVVNSKKRKNGKTRKHYEKRCTANKPYVKCAVSPCKAKRILGTTCEMHPKAKCVNDFCGGCVARHFVGDKEVHCGKDTNVICELHNTSLSCPVNYIMKINHANYGRTDPYTCRHSYNFDSMHNNTRCFSQNATQIISKLCEGRTVCWPEVSSTVFGDSCYGIYKYLKVDYNCIPIQNYFARQDMIGSAHNLIQASSGQQKNAAQVLLTALLISFCKLVYNSTA